MVISTRIELVLEDWKSSVMTTRRRDHMAGRIRIELIFTGSKPVVLPLDDLPFSLELKQSISEHSITYN